MGRPADIFLVDRRALLVAAAGFALDACGGPSATRVDPRDFQAFFLWPGVEPPDWLKNAREVFLLAGEVRHQAGSRFQPLRATPKVRGPGLWLVVRVERLDWSEAIYREVLRTLALWAAAGNHVLGLQVDFDAATRGLSHYASFLKALRHRLPRPWKLSITGLLDWSAGGDPAALRALAGCIDDLVVQTYQGRHTIPGYRRYLARLERLDMPYRIGLVEGGEWRAPRSLAADRNFGGYVVFLLGR